ALLVAVASQCSEDARERIELWTG
ncbi:MAG: hypothetical protein QOJ57_1384, partial [Thermoleophilaceae bacterium]|nr:hypothetical protein [Thermoleophilaceae bacterium]